MQRANRLRTSADFARVRVRKRSQANAALVLYAVPNDLGHPRLGVSVSRRIGKAVVRNRVRRRIREAVRLRLLPDGPGYDFLFIARGPIATADWPSLVESVDDLLRRARVPRGRPRRPERVPTAESGG
jgi:ribonuclease P protein component